MNFKGDLTSSDFKNLFIGANNSKRAIASGLEDS
ncbi:hypothetical protein HPLT_04980 [Helicobacter pylori Lithuania75]|nr:hypothetical protein HPLT_04980 [Helicobacter pylori Lithuania75]